MEEAENSSSPKPPRKYIDPGEPDNNGLVITIAVIFGLFVIVFLYFMFFHFYNTFFVPAGSGTA